MTDLKDALHDLADRPRPVAGAGAEPAELWARGVRRHRWRLAGAVAATIAVMSAGAGLGVLVHAHSDTAPTPVDGTSGSPRLPRSIGVPPKDAAGTADAGPLGRLAVLWLASRDGHAWGSFFGISARTGAYRFLDLPRIAGPQDVALSPDGREVAYWTTGSVIKKPIEYATPDRQMATVAGIARYDTVTGRTRFHPITSAHGLTPEGIRWTDVDTVLFRYGRVKNHHTSIRVSGWTWGPARPPREVAWMADLGTWTSAAHGAHVIGRGVSHAVLPAGAISSAQATRLAGMPRVNWGEVSTDGAFVAAIKVGPDVDTYTPVAALMTGRVHHGRVHGMHRVDVGRVAGIVGWTGPGEVLVLGTPRGIPATTHLLEVDVRTGTSRTIGTIGNPDQWPGVPQYATSLLTRPFVSRAVPKVPEHGWWPAAGWGGLAALVVAGGVLLVRRRGARG